MNMDSRSLVLMNMDSRRLVLMNMDADVVWAVWLIFTQSKRRVVGIDYTAFH